MVFRRKGAAISRLFRAFNRRTCGLLVCAVLAVLCLVFTLTSVRDMTRIDGQRVAGVWEFSKDGWEGLFVLAESGGFAITSKTSKPDFPLSEEGRWTVRGEVLRLTWEGSSQSPTGIDALIPWRRKRSQRDIKLDYAIVKCDGGEMILDEGGSTLVLKKYSSRRTLLP